LDGSAGVYRWAWGENVRSLDRLIWPVTRDAADLLTTGRLERIRERPGVDGCGWLFYDTSRNGRQRWCSMEACGNRAKGRRHYQRQRSLK
jgi:predicted RNA-binding Zn ribbon-like protein